MKNWGAIQKWRHQGEGGNQNWWQSVTMELKY